MAILNSGLAKSSAAAGYEIDNSLRFDDGSSPLLRRTPTATGDRQKMTWSAWVKKCYQNQSEYKKLIHIGSGSDELGLLWFDADEFWFYYYTGSYVAYLKTNAKYRDPSSWYHFVVSIDSTQATASDRIKIYVNGEQVTSFATETYFAQNTNLPNVSGTAMDIGAYTASGIYFDGYFADFYFIDGSQLPASTFGELDSTTNMWKPLDSDDVKDAVTFGTNGFYQKYNSTELADSFNDSSSGDHTITANGDATNQRPQHHDVTANGDAHLVGPKVGTSLITSSVKADYLSVATVSGFDFGTSTNFTAEFWMNCGVQAASVACMIGSGNAGWGTGANLIRMSGSTGPGVEYFHYDGNGATAMLSSTSNVNDRKWHLVSVVRSSTTWYLFIDGTLEDTWTGTNPSTNLAYNGSVYFGKNGWDGTSGEWLGDFGPIRISNNARYTASFDLPTDVWTNDIDTLFLLQNGTDGTQTFTDASSETHTISVSGGMRWFAPKVGAGAMVFDGTGDEFSTASSTDFMYGLADFTHEAWIKPTAAGSSGGDLIIYTGTDSTGNNSTWLSIDENRKIQINAQYSDGGGWATSHTSTNAVDLNVWTHIVLLRQSLTFRIYINGVQDSTVGGNVDLSSTYGGRVGIGNQIGGPREFNGFIDSVRLSRLCRYPDGTTFTPSTTAFTDDINTALLLNADINQGTWAEDTSTGLAISTDSRIELDGTGDYLTVPDSSDWDFGSGAWTVEFWVRPDTLPAWTIPFAHSTEASGNGWYIAWDADSIQFFTASNTSQFDVSHGFSIGKWSHVAMSSNGTTLKAFVDGAEVASVSAATVQADSNTLRIGGIVAGYALDGSMDEIRISDSARYTAAFTPQTRGNPFVADANTKLLIHSDYTGGLGADSSGNYNNFSATNLVATDQCGDTPSNNFATMNPLDLSWSYPTGQPVGPPTLSEGNLKVSHKDGSNGYEQGRGTIAVQSGKWYFEALLTATSGTYQAFGIATTSTDSIRYWGGNLDTQWTYQNDGSTFNNNTQSSSDADTYTTGDIVSIAFDCDAGKIWFAKNNTWQGSGSPNPATGTDARYTNLATVIASDGNPVAPFALIYNTSSDWAINFGSDSSFFATKTAQGNQDGNSKGDFYYAPPTDYLALCTDNLSAPEIALPTDYFDTKLWTGDGTSGAMSTTGLSFQPDFFFQGLRGGSGGGARLTYDSVRGFGNDKEITTESNKIEGGENADEYGYVSGVTSDGVTYSQGSLGVSSGIVYYNTSGATYVSWNWKETPTAGFDIVSYTGTGVARTVSHNLGVVPSMIIVKDLSTAENWHVYHKDMNATPEDYYMELNTTLAGTDDVFAWNDTAPTSSVFTVGTKNGTNKDTDSFIAYLFADIEGYSKTGVYSGNLTSGSDGTFIYLGFKPALFMVKNLTSAYYDTQASDWLLWDNKRAPSLTGPPNYNANTENAWVNTNGNEATSQGHAIDFVSNGVKQRSSGGSQNETTQSYIYYAVASHPFKYSNAR